MVSVGPCPECGAQVVTCDNAVRLDPEQVTYHPIDAPWTIMNLGPMQVASAGGPSVQGTGHALHEHQPPEVD